MFVTFVWNAASIYEEWANSIHWHLQ
jgi:hypothetical protein